MWKHVVVGRVLWLRNLMSEEMSQQASMDHLKGDAASFAISCSSVGAASSADRLWESCRFGSRCSSNTKQSHLKTIENHLRQSHRDGWQQRLCCPGTTVACISVSELLSWPGLDIPAEKDAFCRLSRRDAGTLHACRRVSKTCRCVHPGREL